MQTAISIEPRTVTIVTATALEARAARRAMPGVRVERVGVAMAAGLPQELSGAVISCGIAGALRDDLPTGTVLVPACVLRPGGATLVCDAELVDKLVRAARFLGHEPVCDPLLTSATVVTGVARANWARRGYAGVDMETGIIRAARVAALRVVLDTPRNELSRAWLKPASAWLNAACWAQLPWLIREAPRCARLAAAIAAEAIGVRS